MENVDKNFNIQSSKGLNLVELWNLLKKNIDLRIDLNELALVGREKYILHNKPIDAGVSCRVYFLENRTKTTSFVVKVTQGGSVLNNLSVLHDIAKKYQKDFKFLQKYYGEDIILDESSYISQINKNGRIGVITVQEFVGLDIYDLFKDISQKDLLKILKKDKDLKEKFILFVEKTIKLRKNGKLIDFFGYKNLILYSDKRGKYNLKFIDPHDIRDVEDIDRYFATVYFKNENYLQRVVDILEKE